MILFWGCVILIFKPERFILLRQKSNKLSLMLHQKLAKLSLLIFIQRKYVLYTSCEHFSADTTVYSNSISLFARGRVKLKTLTVISAQLNHAR